MPTHGSRPHAHACAVAARVASAVAASATRRPAQRRAPHRGGRRRRRRHADRVAAGRRRSPARPSPIGAGDAPPAAPSAPIPTLARVTVDLAIADAVDRQRPGLGRLAASAPASTHSAPAVAATAASATARAVERQPERRPDPAAADRRRGRRRRARPLVRTRRDLPGSEAAYTEAITADLDPAAVARPRRRRAGASAADPRGAARSRRRGAGRDRRRGGDPGRATSSSPTSTWSPPSASWRSARPASSPGPRAAAGHPRRHRRRRRRPGRAHLGRAGDRDARRGHPGRRAVRWSSASLALRRRRRAADRRRPAAPDHRRRRAGDLPPRTWDAGAILAAPSAYEPRGWPGCARSRPAPRSTSRSRERGVLAGARPGAVARARRAPPTIPARRRSTW
jgi:hypothetical protein